MADPHETPDFRLPPVQSALNKGILPISVRGLGFSAGGVALIDVEDLSIHAGGPTVILGPNGAGKSLLLRLIHGLISPMSGQILFAGQPLDQSIRQRQAMVFQRPVILRRTVSANVSYALKAQGIPRTERRHKVAALLTSANLLHKASQPARSLSGGEQQVLALIRALAREPEILFLDEPTSSLDPGVTQMIETMIRDASVAGTKIIMVSHDLGQARRLASEVLFCHHGRIIEQSTAEMFFHRPQSDIAQSFIAGGLVL